MSEMIVDARGLECPKPLILTKKALKNTEITGDFVVLIDRENPKENIQRMLKDNKVAFETTKEEEHYKITVKK